MVLIDGTLIPTQRRTGKDVRAPVIVTGFHASRTHKLTPGQKEANRVLAIGRAPVEHSFAHLKNRRTSPNCAPIPPTRPASCAPCSF
ncbi:MAG TPA: hypothetical protein VIU15_24850 [Streptomyces sp.]